MCDRLRAEAIAVMWDDQKRARFEELRQRELDGVLTEAEQAELSQMIQEIEDAEAAYLRPATERLRREREEIEAQNRDLQTVVQRRETFVEKLRSVLAELEAERRAIDEEIARILSQSTPTGVTH